MATLRTLGVLSSAKLMAILMALVGLIYGVLYSVGGFIYELFTGTLNSGTALAFGALVVVPILGAVCGWIAGAGGAFLYNLGARWVGGIEMVLEPERAPQATDPPAAGGSSQDPAG